MLVHWPLKPCCRSGSEICSTDPDLNLTHLKNGKLNKKIADFNKINKSYQYNALFCFSNFPFTPNRKAQARTKITTASTVR